MVVKSAIKGYVINESDLFRDDSGRLVIRYSAYRRIRRYEQRRKPKTPNPEQDQPPFEFIDGKTVRYGPGEDNVFTLQPKPYGLLKYLCECENHAAHYETIAAVVWEESDYLNCDIETAIDKHISPALKKTETGWVISRKNKTAFLKNR